MDENTVPEPTHQKADDRKRIRYAHRCRSPHAGDRSTGNVLQKLASLAADLGVDDLAEQHDHYLYGIEKM
jgi:hypothetical protein